MYIRTPLKRGIQIGHFHFGEFECKGTTISAKRQTFCLVPKSAQNPNLLYFNMPNKQPHLSPLLPSCEIIIV